MNQGNVGQHAGDNGVFHDGGLILAFPDRFMGLFLAFQSQRVPTDAAGAAAPGALTIGQILTGVPSQPPAAGLDDLHRARADQPDRRGPGTRDRGAGQPGDHAADAEPTGASSTRTAASRRLTPRSPPGASLIVALDGAGVQLGNNGGNLILQDETNAQVDVVTYTAEDASSDNRYLRFRR